jgi:hypothetical protein
MAKKKMAGTRGPLVAAGPSPITIGGGSLFINFKRSDFQKNGDTDNHKNPSVKITHLRIVSSEHSVNMAVTQPMDIVVDYS